MNTSCSHSREVFFIELKAKVFTRLVSLQTPVVIHHRERESMTVRRSVGELLKKLTDTKKLQPCCHAVRRETAWELWSSSIGEKLQLHVCGGLEEAYDSKLQFPLAVTPLRRVKNIIKSIKVTSQVSSSKIFVCSSPWALQSSRIARGYRFLLTTRVENIKHAKNNLCSPKDKASTTING